MKSTLIDLARVVLPLCALAACASVEGNDISPGPAMVELSSAGSLGIAAFTPVVMESEQYLRETDGAFFDPVDVEGVTRMVAILCASPDAASRFAVNVVSLASMCRRIWAEEIGSLRSDVKTIEETMLRGAPQQGTLRDLCDRWGVNALLAVEPSVYAEAGRVTEQASCSPFARDIRVGSFLLRIRISHRFALFDGETGRLLASSDRLAEASALPRGAETVLFDLGPLTPQQMVAFMNTEAYSALFEQALRQALKPLLPLFYRSSM